jgi:hypothetical protein
MRLQESPQSKPPSQVVKWYMDPRFWLFLIGLACWIASALLDGGQSSGMRP